MKRIMNEIKGRVRVEKIRIREEKVRRVWRRREKLEIKKKNK